MAMRCPNCSNEISLDETFCGQCGTPVVLSAKPVDPTYRQGLLSSGHYSGTSSTSETFRSGMLPSSNNQPPVTSSGSQQQYGFYQDPMQAMSVLPSQQVQGYPTQNFGDPSAPIGNSGTGQYAPQMQPFQSGNYTATMYPTTLTSPNGQGNGMPPGFTPSPPKKQNNTALIMLSVSIVVALIAILTFGASLFIHNNTATKEQLSHQNATATSIPTPTLAPSPSPTAVPSPTPSPSPELTPTSTPDTGFTFCNNICTSNGFSVEYPSSWSQSPTSDSTGTQFTNPSQADEFASFKTPGMTSMTAGQLVNNDLNNFSSQQGYTTPTPTSSSNTTIGGENWSYQIAYYQSNGQATRIEIYATVHQGKAYLIELQAIDSRFLMVNTQYYELMLARFQFQ